ncbi:arginine--tRNA ligase [Candidatus Falkowbacteria bacterium]|uniref:Arginine--tRNA ligase n=1 Tax=Candidatus Buchananbacteria bacterium CG10_big_fil_rev_8_21_14_0_10_33_19 TaxID=1974525 RepID=A0A2H0W6S0_9BACT|nr:arginine--tRNA ligase [Candidatus Falkowbacteria bacterium]PIS06330.1 MAG: arginine--tRNA ligase [Candidatus Buchananbacteria bacterium CG10_big_fil_rev_8_21_14_0_10_33_19]
MDYIILKIKKQIIDLIAQAIEVDFDLHKLEVVVPPDSMMGDLAVPCFYLSKITRQSPNQIAQELAEKINSGGVIKEIKNIGAYLNFFIDPEILGKSVNNEIQKNKDIYGGAKNSPKKIMLEFSQPNTHKEFHVGHLRNAILGNSLVNILRFSGHKVTAVNYIGDIGAHVAKCLWAYDKFYSAKELPENKGKFLGQVYTDGSQKIESNLEYKKEVDEVLQKLETGDKKWTALWKKTRKWSLDDFDRIYKILGVKFDHFFYESEVEKPGKKMVAELLEQGVAQKSEGAVIIDLEKYHLKQFLLLKSDGSSLYSTKELALAKLKFEKFKIDESIVVVDSRQSFYLQQFFKTMEVIGFDKKMIHIPYEFVTLKDGAMASRKGNVVLFEDFYNQVVDRATIETKNRHEDWPEKKINEVARKIALSAIKFNMLKVGNNSVITFDIDEALSFDGFSGPYIQYTCSRISSVLKKAKVTTFSTIDYSKLNSDLEKEILLQLASFPEVVAESAKNYDPSQVAKYLFDLAKLFSAFYQKSPIINSTKEIKEARLILVDSIRKVLINGLDLLGIEPLDQM